MKAVEEEGVAGGEAEREEGDIGQGNSPRIRDSLKMEMEMEM